MGVRLNLIVIAGIFIGLFAIFPNIARSFGWFLELSPWIFYAVGMTGVLLGISAFLPYNWGSVLRSISYISLFIAILLLEMGVMSVAVEKHPMLNITECKGMLPPEGEKVPQGGIWNAFHATSCILTGYFTKEFTALGFTTFFIFYFLLPWVFIFAYTYGLMRGMQLETWFGGGNVGKNIIIVLSLVISLYATRVMFGAFLLEFLGYGMWGLAGIFIACLLTRGLQYQIEKEFTFEKEWHKTRKKMDEKLRRERQAAKEAVRRIEKEHMSFYTFQNFFEKGEYLHDNLFVFLREDVQRRLKEIRDEVLAKPPSEREKIWRDDLSKKAVQCLIDAYNLKKREFYV